jgi:hypothetical protein
MRENLAQKIRKPKSENRRKSEPQMPKAAENGSLQPSACQRIQSRMTSSVSFRAGVERRAKIDRRAAQLGLDRTRYMIALVDRDLENEAAPEKHRFASEDFIGCVSLGGNASNNAAVRRALQQMGRR